MSARSAVAERYRDADGQCLTCQSVAECTGYRVLLCRWCTDAQEATAGVDDERNEDDVGTERADGD